MNIKEQIGERIKEERKAKGLTQAALAELAGNLKQPRINNWEKGIRTPQHEEIKQIAKILEVSPAYLLCITDSKHPHPLEKTQTGKLLPLFTYKQAFNHLYWFEKIKDENYEEDLEFIPISLDLAKSIGPHAFALELQDESMEPELRKGDILLIDPNQLPKPGSFVLVAIKNEENVIIRVYKELTISQLDKKFALLAINKLWGDVQGDALLQVTIIATIIGCNRKFI